MPEPSNRADGRTAAAGETGTTNAAGRTGGTGTTSTTNTTLIYTGYCFTSIV